VLIPSGAHHFRWMMARPLVGGGDIDILNSNQMDRKISQGATGGWLRLEISGMAKTWINLYKTSRGQGPLQKNKRGSKNWGEGGLGDGHSEHGARNNHWHGHFRETKTRWRQLKKKKKPAASVLKLLMEK